MQVSSPKLGEVAATSGNIAIGILIGADGVVPEPKRFKDLLRNASVLEPPRCGNKGSVPFAYCRSRPSLLRRGHLHPQRHFSRNLPIQTVSNSHNIFGSLLQPFAKRTAYTGGRFEETDCQESPLSSLIHTEPVVEPNASLSPDSSTSSP